SSKIAIRKLPQASSATHQGSMTESL
ncbi:hypothetical protein D018_0740B, partial [Vibrio parahaemolyticus VP2007-007]